VELLIEMDMSHEVEVLIEIHVSRGGVAYVAIHMLPALEVLNDNALSALDRIGKVWSFYSSAARHSSQPTHLRHAYMK